MNKRKLWPLIAAPGLATMGLLLALLLLGWGTAGAATGKAGPLPDPLAQDDSFTISGTVTCKSEVLSDVEVYVWYRDQGHGVLSDTTDNNGYYSVVLESGEYYDLIFNPPCGQECASQALKGVTGPPDQTRNVTLPPGYNVSGTITDGTATTISDVTIYAYNRDTADGFGLRPSRSNGQYCADLVSGTYELGFTPLPCRGLGPKTIETTVDQDKILDVVLPPGFTVSGCITDESANPVPGVQIYAYDDDVGGFGFAPTNETGCYSGTLPTGTFDFQFIPPPWRGLGSITVVDVVSETDECPNTRLPITLPSGFTLSGKVTCNGAPLKNVYVYAKPLEGVSPNDDLVGWGLYTVDDGSYALPLVPGPYSLEFIPPPAMGLNSKETTRMRLVTDTVYNVNLCSICSGDWVIETVDSDGNVGAHTSMALEPNYPYVPHISYQDITNGSLKYARLRSTNWFSETVDSGGDWTSLALVPTHPYTSCISNYDSDGYALRYARRDGVTWTIELVDRGGMHGTSLALASTYPFTPQISYHVPFEVLDLKHAYQSGNSWVIQTVDSYGSVGTYNALALDSNGNPHISYRYWDTYDLKYAWWSGTTWHRETVDSEGDVGSYTSLALDSSSNPHISYFDETNDDLKYAQSSEATWLIKTVDSVGDVGRFTSLVLDSNDNSHISYYDAANGNLKLAYSNGTAWFIQTVDNEGDVGQYSSLALDGDGCPHISYYDATHGDLKYAYLPVYHIYLPIILKNY